LAFEKEFWHLKTEFWHLKKEFWLLKTEIWQIDRQTNRQSNKQTDIYRPRWRPGRSQTGMKIEIVNMFTWDRYENHKIFNLFPLPGNFLLQMAFVSMYRSQCQGYSRDRSEMYLWLHSSQSEFMPVWSQSEAL
jgi:hypothetical protein